MQNGAPGGIRTHDQLIKSQLLYQLSYRGDRLFRIPRLRQRPATELNLAAAMTAAGKHELAQYQKMFAACKRRLHGLKTGGGNGVLKQDGKNECWG